jgi:hypothetical protein
MSPPHHQSGLAHIAITNQNELDDHIIGTMRRSGLNMLNGHTSQSYQGLFDWKME